MLILCFLTRLPAVPVVMWSHVGWLRLSIKAHVLHKHLTHAAVKACKPPLVCKGLLHCFCCQGAAAGACRHPGGWLKLSVAFGSMCLSPGASAGSLHRIKCCPLVPVA